MKKILTALALLVTLSNIGQGQQLVFPVAPAAPTIRFFGTPAAQSYYYWVTARYPWGVSIVSPSAGTTTATNPLSVTNLINVVWATLPQATGYDLLRTTTNVAPTGGCNCALVVNTLTPSYNDIGNALLTYTVVTPGLTFSDSTVQTTAAPGAGGSTALKIATLNDTSNNVPVETVTGAGASAVNNIQLTNATTTNAPLVNVIGSDTNIDLKLGCKGTCIVNIPNVVYEATLTITTANLNIPASNVLVAAVAGRTLTPVRFTMQALGGNTSGCTAVILEDTNGAPVVIATEAIAGLVQNQVIDEASGVANLTLGVGWQAALTTGQGIQVVKSGGACATATSFVLSVQYKIS